MAPVVDAGPDQSTGLSCPTCAAAATVTGQASNYTLNPGQNLTYAWSLNSGPAPVQFTSATSASTQVTFPAAGTYTLHLSANDGVATSSGLTHVIVNPPSTGSGSPYLTPGNSGPDALNSPVSFQANWVGCLFRCFNFANAQLQITVTGANPRPPPSPLMATELPLSPTVHRIPGPISSPPPEMEPATKFSTRTP